MVPMPFLVTVRLAKGKDTTNAPQAKPNGTSRRLQEIHHGANLQEQSRKR